MNTQTPAENPVPILLWKTMLADLKSANGNTPWKIGGWQKVEPPLVSCRHGFHCSENLIDAFRFVQPRLIARVEVRGEHIVEKDKQYWQEMRIVEAKEWTKEDSVSLAIFAAELVLENFESKYPTDKRPRKAIEAAKEWLKNPSSASSAAWSAAWSAA